MPSDPAVTLARHVEQSQRNRMLHKNVAWQYFNVIGEKNEWRLAEFKESIFYSVENARWVSQYHL